MKQVPAHPHNQRLLEEGKIDARLQHNRDRNQFFELPAPIRAVIDNVLSAASFPKHQHSMRLELARAYMLDDNGRAYRKVLKRLKL